MQDRIFTGAIDGVGPYEITRLSLGTLTVPAGTPMGGSRLPVNAYLLAYQGGLLLFDTGLGDESADFDPILAPVTRSPLGACLEAMGIRSANISALVNCHFHYDHCGGNPLFPGVPVFAQRAEFDARNLIGYYIPGRVEFAGANLHLVHGEQSIAPGIRVIPTPGHTPGHQSLVIDDAMGPIILAGQASYTVAEFVNPEDEPARGFKTAWNGVQFLQSIERLRGLNPQRVYFAHDDEDYAALTTPAPS